MWIEVQARTLKLVAALVAGATALVVLGMTFQVRDRAFAKLTSVDRDVLVGCAIVLLLGLCSVALVVRPPRVFFAKLIRSPLALLLAGSAAALLTDRPNRVLDFDTLSGALLAGFLLTQAVRRSLLAPRAERRRQFDDPIAKPKEDLFGRSPAIRNLYNRVVAFDTDAIRVALTGRWGSGKSSCLNLLRHYARLDGFPVTPTINAWTCRTRDELWLAFVDAVDAALVPESTLNRGPFWLRRLRKFGIRLGVDLGSRYFSPGSAVGELLRRPNSRKRERAEIEEVLREYINDKRLLVLIDDLDRAEPEVAYEILLAIKELVDLPHCIFVVAYDEEAINRILQKRYDAQSQSFLEKIFNLFVDIEEFTQPSEQLLPEFLKAFPDLRLEDLPERSMLPVANPRRLKTYLLRIATLRGTARFGEHLNWRMIYLVVLAREYYPDLMAALETDPAFTRWIQLVRMMGDAEPEGVTVNGD